MNEERYRQLARTALAPWVEEVPEGREWSELEEVASPVVTRPMSKGAPGWIVAIGAAAAVMVVFGVTSLVSPTDEATRSSGTPGASSEEATDAEPQILDLETNSQVYFSDGSGVLTEVDIDARSVTAYELPELAPGDPLYKLVSRGDVLVFYGQTDGGSAVFAFDPASPTAAPVLIDDEAWFFVPSAVEDRVWIAILDPSSPDTVRALEAVREVTVAGTVTTGDVVPPVGRWPVAAVGDGLLFQGEDALEIWDPETQELVETLPGPFPVATWGNRIAACGLHCDQLELVDLEVDTRRTIDLPEGVTSVDGYGGAFSPDGRYMAVPGHLTEGPLTPESELVVVLVDFEGGEASVIPATLTDNRLGSAQVAWSANGEWLFMGPFVSAGGRGELRAYQPGAESAYRVPIELGNQYFGMAAD